MKSKSFGLLIFGAVITHSPTFAWTPDPLELLDKLNESAKKFQNYSFIQTQRERFGDSLGPEIKVKVKYSHGRVYIKVLDGPNQDAEVLYNPKTNDGKVKVHKGSFPRTTVNLDPRDSNMMKFQHHPVFHVGFKYIADTLNHGVQSCRHFPESGSVPYPETTGSSTVKAEFKAPWKTIAHQVSSTETLWVLAEQKKTDPYLILHANHLSEPGDLAQGMNIQIPICYATRTLLELDRGSFLPSRLETYDSHGELYESYTWSQVDTTPLADVDFDPSNPAYNFNLIF